MIVGFNKQCLPTFLIMLKEYTSNILGTTVHSVISFAAQGVLLKPIFIFSTRKIKLCDKPSQYQLTFQSLLTSAESLDYNI